MPSSSTQIVQTRPRPQERPDLRQNPDRFDLAAVAELAYYLELADSGWRLAEEADYQADFHRHAGHDPRSTRLSFYGDALEVIATALPDGYPVPGPEEFDEDWHLHTRLAQDALRNICSCRDYAACATIDKDGDSQITIEMALDDDRSGIVWDTPIHVCETEADGSRTELSLLIPENCTDYEGLAWLLDEGAALLAEAQQE